MEIVMGKREITINDTNDIIAILDKARVLHLGLIDDGHPYVVPMNYGYTMESGRLSIYMHSAVNAHKIEVIEKNPDCFFEIDCDIEPFAGRIPCQYGTSYSMLSGKGKIKILEDIDEKIKAMQIFVRCQTGRDFEFEFNERTLSAVSMLKIEADEYYAKRRPLPSEREKNSK